MKPDFLHFRSQISTFLKAQVELLRAGAATVAEGVRDRLSIVYIGIEIGTRPLSLSLSLSLSVFHPARDWELPPTSKTYLNIVSVEAGGVSHTR